jgi:hypothetical protein
MRVSAITSRNFVIKSDYKRVILGGFCKNLIC